MTPSAHLLALLADSHHARQLSLADWDSVLRLGRQARLLGMLHQRLSADPEQAAQIPAAVDQHLRAARNYTAYRRQLVIIELAALAKALPEDLPVTLLKGAAYIAQGLPLASGRLPNDVDLLVNPDDLDRAEQALTQAGWAFQAVNAYDERYYRQWSHELPPLRFPGHPLEVDLHHNITPVTGRVKPNLGLLFGDLQPLAGQRWQVLHPAEQIIHAAVHLFQDSELSNKLRELVDIDSLIRSFIHTPADWQPLIERAEQHGATTALGYALEFSHRWLGLSVPEDCRLPAPRRWGRTLTLWTFTQAGLPTLPDQPPSLSRRLAQYMGLMRYHWLRMPPGLLIRHLAVKSVRRLKVGAGKNRSSN